MSRQNKFTSAPFSASIACAKNLKTYWNKRFLLFFVQQKVSRESWVFCICYFWRTKHKLTEAITEWCFSCQNKAVCQKLARCYKKWKSAKNSMYALFARSLSISTYTYCDLVVLAWLQADYVNNMVLCHFRWCSRRRILAGYTHGRGQCCSAKYYYMWSEWFMRVLDKSFLQYKFLKFSQSAIWLLYIWPFINHAVKFQTVQFVF